MAQNIQIVEGVSTNSHKVIETCNRPLLIKYLGSGTPLPTMVQIDVFIKEKIDGVFVFVKKGSSLIQSRDVESTENAPTFTFDISSVLKSGVIKDANFTLFGVANNVTGIERKGNFPLIYEYKVSARSWYIDSETGVLTYNSTDVAVSTADNTLFFCDIEVPDNQVLLSSSSNLKPFNPRLSGWLINSALTNLASSGWKKYAKFLTNCPSNLRRKLPIGSSFSLSVLVQSPGAAYQVVADYINDAGTNITEDSLLTGNFIISNSNVINTVNLTPTSSFMFNGMNNVTQGGIKPNIDIYLKKTSDGSTSENRILIELINNSDSKNSRLKSIDNHVIYFVNDYNVLDFYTFEGNLGVNHVHSKSTFNKGFKDYTKRDSSNFGVSRGVTEVIYTLSTIVNREASEWLSEICRSTNVFVSEYDVDGVLRPVPVLVVDSETVPLPQDRRNLEQFTISFRKDVHHVNL